MELLPLILFAFIPLALFIGITALIYKFASRKSRLPFDYSEMSRTPGFSLLCSHREETLNMLLYSLLSVAFFQLPFSIPTIAHTFDVADNIGAWWAYALAFFIASAYALYKSARAFKEIRNLRLGIEAEWAVANSLAQISDPQVRVFHDVQGPNFNIDHVLTYPGGVLAIETKGRRKPNQDANKHSHKVEVSGNELRFPHYRETSTVEQAVRQAKWLSDSLTSSTGMNLKANPMVVIPGWYIDIKSKPTVPVLNNKNLVKYYRLNSSNQLGASELTRINHQLGNLSKRNSDEF